MRLIELGEIDTLEALAAEEAVLEAVEGGAEGAWLAWSAARPCAVLGTARPAGTDLRLETLRADGLAVLRRRSGGGTVILGRASPAVTLVEERRGDIRESYQLFCRKLIAALGRLGLEAGFRPPADLAVAERKVAGLAQRRRRRGVLVTASVLAAPLAEAADRYLPEPAAGDAPAYRAGRAHREFMTSLEELGARPGGDRFGEALRAELTAAGASPGKLTAAEIRRAAELAAELADPAWVYRL